MMLSKYPSLIQSFIDTSNTWQILKPALLAMKFNQMLIQSIWYDDSSLLQLPHITSEILSNWKKNRIESLDDFFDLEDEERENILKEFTKEEVEHIAQAANRFPSVTLEAQFTSSGSNLVESEVNGDVSLTVNIERDNWDEDELKDLEGNGKLMLPYVSTNNKFVQKKQEYWWLVIGDKGRNMLLYVKKIQFNEKVQKVCDFSFEKEGEYNLSVFLICDSYLGCDTEIQDMKAVIKPSVNDIQEE